MSENRRVCCQVDTGSDRKEKLTERIVEYFKDQAYVYAVLDYAVGLGIYENGEFSLRLDQDSIEKELPFEFLKELMVFDKNQELRAVRSGDLYLWRFRRDTEKESYDQEPELYCKDEVYKIWGNVRTSSGSDGWTLLQSKRGSQIYLPGASTGKEKGLCIRRYIQFPDATEGNGLIKFVDERLCGFCDWPPEEEVSNG